MTEGAPVTASAFRTHCLSRGWTTSALQQESGAFVVTVTVRERSGHAEQYTLRVPVAEVLEHGEGAMWSSMWSRLCSARLSHLADRAWQRAQA